MREKGDQRGIIAHAGRTPGTKKKKKFWEESVKEGKEERLCSEYKVTETASVQGGRGNTKQRVKKKIREEREREGDIGIERRTLSPPPI